MELASVLEEFGLRKNEAGVYVALLQLGPSSVLAIARRTGLKRPTVYPILDELIKKNFAAVVPHEKKKLFLALPPDRLAEASERRSALLAKALPELSALYRSQTAKPSLQVFESREGMMSIYREIAASKGLEILSFFSLEAVPQEFSESFELLIAAVRSKRIWLREIAYGKDRSHFYIQKTKNLPGREIRFTTTEHKFLTDSFIYGNRVALFSFKKRFALVIESGDVATSLRSLFELAWQSAEKV